MMMVVVSQEKDEEKDLDLGHCDEHESPLPLTVTSRVTLDHPLLHSNKRLLTLAFN